MVDASAVGSSDVSSSPTASTDSGAGRRCTAAGRFRRAFAASVVGHDITGPKRGDDGYRQVGHPLSEVVEEPQRGFVGPLRVLHDERQRPVVGGVEGEPVQAMDSRERVSHPSSRLGQGPEQRGSEGRRSGEEIAWRSCALHLAHERPEQGERHAVWIVALQLAAGGPERPQAVLAAARDGMTNE